jgi:hypothetical protein
MTVTRTGVVRSNAEAKDDVLAFIQAQGGNPNNFQLAFGANGDLGQLALYYPRPGDVGLMKVSVYDHSIGFHAGAVFLEFPQLRPASTVDCYVELTKDAEGVDCLVIQLHGAAPTRTVKRKKKDGTPKPREEKKDETGEQGTGEQA